MSTSSEAVHNFEALKLTSTSKGAFTKFKERFNDCLDDLIANNINHSDDYLKLALMNKLPAEGYKHLFVVPGYFTDHSLKATLERLSDSAVHIERADEGGNPNKSKKSQIHNTNSDGGNSNTPSKPIPNTIGGFKVDKNGFISNPSEWKKLSYQDRTKYFHAKNKLAKEGVQFPSYKDSNKDGDSKKGSEANKEKGIKARDRMISKLQEQLKEAQKEESPSDKNFATKSTLNNLTFTEIVKRCQRRMEIRSFLM